MDSRPHILFVSSWYPNKNKPLHGIFNYYFAQVAALQNKVSVLHVSADASQQAEAVTEVINEPGLFTLQVYYKKVQHNLPIISNWLRLRKLKQGYKNGFAQLVAKNGMPSLIHLNVAIPAGVAVLELARQYKIPYVLNENWSGYCPEDGNYKGFFLKHFTRRIVRNARVIMPTSHFLKEAMMNHGLKGHYEVVPNVVNTRVFIPQGHETGSKKFIHVSSLKKKKKNVKGIIRAFAAALKQIPDLELVIVGDGPEREELQMFANECVGKGKIVFKGHRHRDDLVNDINNASCLVMFSYFETFCLVIMEAFACGKPVITSNAGAIAGYMTTDLGIMVEKRNEIQLTQAFIDFATAKKRFDPVSIRNFVEGYCSYEKVSQQLTAIYARVISEYRK